MLDEIRRRENVQNSRLGKDACWVDGTERKLFLIRRKKVLSSSRKNQ